MSLRQLQAWQMLSKLLMVISEKARTIMFKMFDEEEFESDGACEVRRLMANEFVHFLIKKMSYGAIGNFAVFSLVYALVNEYDIKIKIKDSYYHKNL
jgi:hypothetical protein